MVLRFPSLEFLQMLQKLAADGATPEPSAPGEALIGLEVDGHPFMVEFEDGVCVAAALGGNPNDLDFTLAAPRGAWLELFERIGAAATPGRHPLAEMVGVDGPIRLETVQEDGAQRFAASRASLEGFFAGAPALLID